MSFILAGNIGGAKTKLALFEYSNGTLKKRVFEKYDTKRFSNFYILLRNFLEAINVKPTAACFAAAGPCFDNVCKMTNVPWTIDAAKISKLFGIKKVTVINDYVALGFGVEVMHKKDLIQIKSGTPIPYSTKAVIGAGTGLGEAIIVWNGHDDIVVASEGGHTDFAARNEYEFKLKMYIKKRTGWMDYESLVSKGGLYNIYCFLIESGEFKENPKVRERLNKFERHEVIAEEALKGKDPACKKAVDMFVSFYAAEAGNLALKSKAIGGVFLMGSLTRLLVKKLKSPIFARSFEDKSKMGPLLKQIPVYAVMNEEAGLLGAANLASKF
ncbi:MAG: glucokinase [Candidatus Woesearchaeota archaeon]